MSYQIDTIRESEYPEVVDVWEASVRATHHFLTEEDIMYFKPLILMVYLKAMNLRGVRNEQGKIIGFMGAAAGNLEMLFEKIVFKLYYPSAMITWCEGLRVFEIDNF